MAVAASSVDERLTQCIHLLQFTTLTGPGRQTGGAKVGQHAEARCFSGHLDADASKRDGQQLKLRQSVVLFRAI